MSRKIATNQQEGQMLSATVYSKPQCVQCNATYRHLDKRGVDYKIIDITVDTEAYELVKSLGYQQAPVMIVRDEGGVIIDQWSGFRPDNIDKLLPSLLKVAA